MGFVAQVFEPLTFSIENCVEVFRLRSQEEKLPETHVDRVRLGAVGRMREGEKMNA